MEIVYNLDELDLVAQQIIASLTNKVLLFDAQMGAGKTTLIKALLKNLGVNASTASPTFSLVNEYTNAAHQKFYHFDLYRLNSEEEAYDFGIEEYLYADAWCFIEWPEKASNILPKNHTKISIAVLPNGKRKLFIK